MFFSTCWVRVEPPMLASPWKMFRTALPVRSQSTPWCWKKRSSSMATVACQRYSGIWSKSTSTRFSGPWTLCHSFHAPLSLS